MEASYESSWVQGQAIVGSLIPDFAGVISKDAMGEPSDQLVRNTVTNAPPDWD